MLKHNLNFSDLHSLEGLKKIDDLFTAYLANNCHILAERLSHYRDTLKAFDSNFIIEISWHLEDFLSELFSLQYELACKSDIINELAVIYRIKRLFIQRQAAKYKKESFNEIDTKIKIIAAQNINPENELEFAQAINNWIIKEDFEHLEAAKYYAAWALYAPEGIAKHKAGVLFKQPIKYFKQEDYLEVTRTNCNTFFSNNIIKRNGFSLSEHDLNLQNALDHAHYCINCHNQGKDSCSKGFLNSDLSFKTSQNNIKLTGCPLEEKISEMNQVKSQGSIIGALAIVTIDNPLCAGTGHRICNDCMKACIYQKQEPVNIPLVETQVLDDVLSLPYGFEIYSLLTRWNPLKATGYLPKPLNHKKVLICGQGPAGYTLAHYLLNEGFTVVAIDGLKIEPLNQDILNSPIKDTYQQLYEDLSERIAYGFGGVAEYGITVRWNKNYLKLIRLLLERRLNYALYGGIRFGSNITYQDAKELGFDHIALALGAGKPNLLDLPKTLAKGVRTASDFLMSLQLTGAARENSLANLEIQMPICVIGGGLTAVDTATEALAYYPIMVEKFLQKYELVGESLFAKLSAIDALKAKEYLAHAKLFREKPQDTLEIMKSLGGVKILYRKSIYESPAFRLNHEELQKALNEGIEFVENFEPSEIHTDNTGAIQSIRSTAYQQLSAKSLLLAIGTQPNNITADEEPTFTLNGKYFQAVDKNGTVVSNDKLAKPSKPNIILKNRSMHLPSVSFFGDLHPSYTGNVVKAMASAKQGYTEIVEDLAPYPAQNHLRNYDFLAAIKLTLTATVVAVKNLAPNILEVIINSKLAAKNFKPGQFFRLQNFESNCPKIGKFNAAMEGLALTGASANNNTNEVSLIVLEMGGSSDFCKLLKPNENVVLMGPTGEPTAIPTNENIILIGGGLGNAVLFSIGKSMKQNNCKVIYFAGYRKATDRYKIEEIEAAADQIIWCCDEQELDITRKSDHSFKGNIVQALESYANGNFSNNPFEIIKTDRLLVIGSDRMMAAVAYARHNTLKDKFNLKLISLASINSPMQCMMKEICGQCIQRQVDPINGKESYIFSCKTQDQSLDDVDFNFLQQRLTQNQVQEAITKCILEMNI